MIHTNISIKKSMEQYNVAGLSISVINSGRISFVENYGLLEVGTNRKVGSNSIFSACSISKFLTAMLVLKLVEQGILDLDEDVNKKLISWKVPNNNLIENKRVTLRNLLCHQSGIIDPQESFMELNSIAGVPSMVELLNGNTPYCKTPIEVKCEPESTFQYSDAGFCIIQQLIEDVTAKPFEEVIEELIFHPLKMTNSTFTPNISGKGGGNFSCGHNKDGKLVDGKYPTYPYPAASGLWTSSLNLSQLVLEFINALNGDSKIGISANKAKEMIKSQGSKEWTGLGIFLDNSEKELEISSLGWGVGFQCMMIAYPHLRNGLIIMTNTDLGVHQLKGIIGEVYRSLSFM